MQRLWQPDALDQPDVRIVGVMELLIGKLLALLDRGAARDVWDVANLPKAALQVVESDEFAVGFSSHSPRGPHPLTTYTRRRLENLATDQVLTDQLLPMLMRNVAPNLSTLVPRAWDVIADSSRLLPLNPSTLLQLNKVKFGLSCSFLMILAK